ncbi:MAG: VWA domain-containing protein [Calditrichia bacterium]
MLAEDVAPNRFDRAKQEISNFIDELRGDRVGLILFSSLAFVQCPLTLDYGAAKLFLDESNVGSIPQPGTSISEAIRTAMTSFVSQEQKYKVLIVITDGEDHEDDPVEVAQEAAESGVLIYTVGVGSPAGAPIPEYNQRGQMTGYKKDNRGQTITTKLDVLTLEKIADAANGKFCEHGRCRRRTRAGLRRNDGHGKKGAFRPRIHPI